MKIRTHLGNTIEAVDSAKTRYDKNVKEILADIQVLARIVKHTVAEVRQLSISEIMSCIDRGSIRIGAVPMEPGLANVEITTELEGRFNSMCNLSEVVEERGIKKGVEQGLAQGIEKGIRGLVDILREMGTPKEIIIDKIMEKFALTEAQAEKFVQ